MKIKNNNKFNIVFILVFGFIIYSMIDSSNESKKEALNKIESRYYKVDEDVEILDCQMERNSK